MRRNAVAIGERSLSGEFNRIFAAGEVHISDSNVKRIFAAGEVSAANSSVQNLRVAGEFSADRVNIASVKAAGELNFKGICKADTVSVVGEIHAEHLESQIIRLSKIKKGDIQGNLRLSGYFKAKTFEHFHPIELDFEYDFDNILSSALLSAQKEIACENFYSFDNVSADCINAETIFILTGDNVKIASLAGKNILVKNRFIPSKNFNKLPALTDYKTVEGSSDIAQIGNIEGDTVDIEYTKSDCVSGIDVVIGDLCVVGRAEYKNSIKISDKAVVGEVVKL